MYNELLKTVTSLGSPRVLVVGDFMLDIYIFGDAQRISPEAPVVVLNVKETREVPGGAASVVADVLALGGEAVCVGIIGNDHNGGILRDMLKGQGADVEGLLVVEDRVTTTKQRLIGLAQHRHSQQLMRFDYENTEPLSDATAEKILASYERGLSLADIVCIQDYDKGVLGGSMCQRMIEKAKAVGKKVLVDPSLNGDYNKYKNSTAILPNRFEASKAVGFDIVDMESAAAAADEFIKRYSLEALILTLDKEGMYLKTEALGQQIATKPKNVYDVSGAGDMVLATVAVALAGGCDYVTAVRLGNITAGIEVEKIGTATVSIEEVINEIVGENLGRSGKIHSIDTLLVELDYHRKQKKTIVFTNGCFDVLHRGHIEYLGFCKKQGDIVVVGLNSDRSVKAIKGPERPVNNQYDRALVLAAMESVDYITVFDENDPLSLIKKIGPDVLVKGQDWEEKGVVGREFVEAKGGKVVLAPLVEGKSSTAIIEKMKILKNKIKKIKDGE